MAWDQAWVHGCIMAAITSLINVGIFVKWAEQGAKSITTAALAKLTSSDAVLLRRLLRQVAGEFLIIEVAEDTHASTPWALRVGTKSKFASIYKRFYHDMVTSLFINLQRIYGEDSSFCHSAGNFTSWVDLYDTGQVIQEARPGRPLVVDIGGSKGHDIEKFLQRYPDVPKSRLILQNLPEALEKYTIHSGVAVQPYNFFTPQPANEILKTLVATLETTSLTATTLDITMMALLSALEQSEDQWRQVLGGHMTSHRLA
ncbi:S-adenosyl-L-methionine-dependent methyltransferase [Xylariomycetidae sp. FL0641]|nr:S-adenosyl-L-methionine-dependent methyltransferase [Xylariomycetidae sp. FL0641]